MKIKYEKQIQKDDCIVWRDLGFLIADRRSLNMVPVPAMTVRAITGRAIAARATMADPEKRDGALMTTIISWHGARWWHQHDIMWFYPIIRNGR